MDTREYPLGRSVVCDWCDKDFTDSPAEGGFLFAGKAACPECVADMEAAAVLYGEQRFITARAGVGESFADFVRRIRGPDAVVRVVTFEKGESAEALARALGVKYPRE